MNASLFDKMSEISVKNFQDYLSDLRLSCEADPAISQFVEYILEYGVQQSLNKFTAESQIGYELCQFIQQITGKDLSSGGCGYNFNLAWISDLNDFVSDYFYEDEGFNFRQREPGGVFEFFACSDAAHPIPQPPRILVKAAIANAEYYDSESEDARVMGHHVYAIANHAGY